MWFTDGVEGTEPAGVPCVFPFLLNGELQFSCVPTVPPVYEHGWCGTTDTVDSDNKWGTCMPVPVASTITQNVNVLTNDLRQ